MYVLTSLFTSQTLKPEHSNASLVLTLNLTLTLNPRPHPNFISPLLATCSLPWPAPLTLMVRANHLHRVSHMASAPNHMLLV